MTYDHLVKPAEDRPTAGWRAAMFTLTAGTINLGPSRRERHERERRQRIRSPLGRPHSVVVLSMKGGVGKTTIAALLGLTFAAYRGDQVIALDANPDAGTLADRLLGHSPPVSVRDLAAAAAAGTVRAPTDLARYTSLIGRLAVLASEHDPAKSEAFDHDEYEHVITLLRRFFHVVITDSGTGVTHSTTAAALAAAGTVVVVGGPTVDGASRASKTLDWLRANGHSDLAARAVVALSADRTSPDVDSDTIHRYLKARCRTVVTIPLDPHLATGGRIDLTHVKPATYASALELAAAVVADFPPSG
jgi:MinD-like ATPase involved in chromosome partitioning or flagellar assembly